MKSAQIFRDFRRHTHRGAYAPKATNMLIVQSHMVDGEVEYHFPFSVHRRTNLVEGDSQVREVDLEDEAVINALTNAPRAPRDLPKNKKKEPKTAAPKKRTERQRRARQAAHDRDYVARARQRRREEVINFLEAVSGIGGQQMSEGEIPVPFVEPWMFPIAYGHGKNRPEIKSKADFLWKFKPHVAPGVRSSERYSAPVTKTEGKRRKASRRAGDYDEDESMYPEIYATSRNDKSWTEAILSAVGWVGDTNGWAAWYSRMLASMPVTKTASLVDRMREGYDQQRKQQQFDHALKVFGARTASAAFAPQSGLPLAVAYGLAANDVPLLEVCSASAADIESEQKRLLCCEKLVSSMQACGIPMDADTCARWTDSHARAFQSQLNGTHGEATNSDDVLTAAQHQFAEQYGVIDITPVFPTGLLGSATTGNYQADVRVHFVQPEAWPSTTGRSFAAYGNSLVVDEFYITDPVDWIPVIAATNYWTVWSPQAGIAVYPLSNYNQAVPFNAVQSTVSVPRHFTTDWFGLRCLMEQIDPIAPAGRVAFLNGNNGEATNTDDVRRNRGGRRRQARQRPAPAPARRRQRRPRRAPVTRHGLSLSSCAMKYAKAIADPFSPESAGACIPTFPSPDSMKVKTMTRAVTIVVGSSGVGGAFLCTSAASDVPIAAVTTAQFSGSVLTMPAVAVTGDFAFAYPNAPFTMSDFVSDSVEARQVSYGVKVGYTGTQLDMGGTIAGYFEPMHRTVAMDANNVQSISNLPYGSFENVDRRMNFRLQTASVDTHETIFEENVNPYCNNTETTSYDQVRQGACGVIVVYGKAGTTFNIEIVQHLEYIGRAVASSVTPTHTDSRGFEMVQQAAGQLATATASNRQSSWSVMQRLLTHAASELAPVAMQGISLVARGIAGRQRAALGFH